MTCGNDDVISAVHGEQPIPLSPAARSLWEDDALDGLEPFDHNWWDEAPGQIVKVRPGRWVLAHGTTAVVYYRVAPPHSSEGDDA